VSGSRKGIPNKIGSAVKSNVVAVFDRIGGRDGMADWAMENLTEFYRLYARLIPTESTLDITFKDVSELSTDDLLIIAAGGSIGAAEAQGSPEESSELH
jgi:hypothetical protein